MSRTVSDITADMRATRERMDRLGNDIAVALMRGWVADAERFATGPYADAYRKYSGLMDEWGKAYESGRG
ncbi:hypothetical protein [Brevibacterium paucivorans]|uniref:hypothetical protein n=1 Tax=Brevibacterium paucivorans TaxID=170994 RepID=UPI00321B20E4